MAESDDEELCVDYLSAKSVYDFFLLPKDSDYFTMTIEEDLEEATR